MNKFGDSTFGNSNDSDKIVHLPSAEDIELEAAEWLAVLGRQDVSAADKAALRQWLTASDRHRTAFDELFGLWEDLEALKDLSDIAEGTHGPAQKKQTFLNRRNLSALAASFALIAVSGGAYLAYKNRTVQETGAFVTAIGEQRSIDLSDGSSLQLNTNSRLEIDFSREQRVIRLAYGEAHFDVAHDKRRPFLVRAPGGSVEAVGTSFAVRVRPDNAIEVTVEEGRVALAKLAAFENAENSPAPQSANIAGRVQLTAGQSAVFSERVGEIRQLPEPELKRKLSWRLGMLAYSGETLVEVIEDISRYTDVTIEIADPAIQEKLVAGYFRIGEIEALFESLERSFGVEVQRLDADHVRLVSAL